MSNKYDAPYDCPNTIRLTYIGKRMLGKHLVHAYEQSLEQGSTTLYFKKPLVTVQGLGTVVEAINEPGSKSFSKSHVIDCYGFGPKIQQWSVDETLAKAKHEQYKALSMKPDNTVDALIDAIRNNTDNYTDRRRICMYITARILH